MSQKIYFNTASSFSLRRKLINLGTRLHHTMAPSHARRTARKLLLTPVRSKPKNTEPAGLIKDSISTSEGVIKTYRLGIGPTWVLSHGWSGTASQFYPLMEHIAKQGYTALAYDHPAHGESEGQYGHLPAFIHGFDELLDTVDSVVGVVAHSMGTASVLESRHAKVQSVPFLLIAPVLNYTENLFNSVIKSGYSLKLFKEVVGEVEQRYQHPISSINPYQRLLEREAKTIIVHDKQDKFTHFDVSQNAANEGQRVDLIATQGQGHGRVMQCNQTMTGFDSLI